MKKILFLFASLFALGSCEELNMRESSADTISGFAQKGFLVEGSRVTAIAYGGDMTLTGETFPATISGSLGAFSVNVKDANAEYFELKAEGCYFDEITGNNTESPICLEAFVKSSDSNANLNLFTTIIKERIKKIISSGKSYDEAKIQAQVEFFKTVNLVGADIDFTKLDITGGSDADAMLLLTTCAIQNERNAGELTVILQKASSEFKENGTFSENTAKELFRPGQELDMAIVFENLKKYYEENGLSKDDLPSYWRYFYLGVNETMAIISSEGFSKSSYTDLETPESASGTYKIVSIEPFTVSTDVDWITFEKRELEKEVYELKVNIAENKAYEKREGHLFLNDINSKVIKSLTYVQGPVIDPKVSLIGEGTIEDPFIIECLDDLIYLRDVYNRTSDRFITPRGGGPEVYASGAVFQLTSDIDLSSVCGPDKGDWTPIGIIQGNDVHNNRSGFDGTFICSKTDSNGALLPDSPGYTISGLYINNDKDYQGLFGVFKGVVCDLIIEGNVSGRKYVGLFAGYVSTEHITNIETRGKVSSADAAGGIAGSFEGIINNCTNYADVTSNNSYFDAIGGIIGRSTGTINHCVNHGLIDGSYRSGGIVGEGSNIYIYDCKNIGKVSGEGAGGIVCDIEGVINDCVNYADITSEGLCGGIAAHSSGGTINHSRNYGSISGNSAGGIVDMCTSDIYDCANYGNVSAGCSVGGIVGDTFGNIMKPMEIVNCCNNGDLNLTFTKSLYYSAGGIVGTVGYDENSFYSIVNCYSTGTFPFQGNGFFKSFGGICGELIHSSNIKVAHNYYLQKEMPAIGNVEIRTGDNTTGDFSNIIENCFLLTPEQMKGLEPYDGVLYKSKDGKSVNTLLESLNAFLEDNKNDLPNVHFWEYSSTEPFPVHSKTSLK